ncbi:PPP4R2-domain-containing protein [Pyronema omphalodes]|nr:PPP4R2-domain-containing protein [Pyronema omphalodes]
MSTPKSENTMDLDSSSDEAILLAITKDGSMDASLWPTLLPRLLSRLDSIASSFPSVPSAGSDITPPSSPSADPHLLSLKTTLTNSFPLAPPYTVQRLAELLLQPKQHYTSLPKFIRALERVLSVTSTTERFPLPSEGLDTGEGEFTSLGRGMGVSMSGLGSDEALGGALLTKIPWLTEKPAEPVETMQGPEMTEEDVGKQPEGGVLSPQPVRMEEDTEETKEEVAEVKKEDNEAKEVKDEEMVDAPGESADTTVDEVQVQVAAVDMGENSPVKMEEDTKEGDEKKEDMTEEAEKKEDTEVKDAESEIEEKKDEKKEE